MKRNKTMGAGWISTSYVFRFRGIWPFVLLEVNPDSITYCIWPVKYTFEKARIRSLKKDRLFWFPHLVIDHAYPTYPWLFIFNPLRFSELHALLTENGYQVIDKVREETPRYVNFTVFIESILVIAGLAFVLWETVINPK